MLMPVVLANVAAAKNQQKTTSVPYVFRTLLVPDRPAERSRIVKKHDPWFTGKAVPAQAVVLNTSISIPGTPIVLEKGLPLSVATSAVFMACQKDRSVPNGIGGMGRSPICLIDQDEDGILDSWFKSSINIVWSSYSGHLQRDDIYPIGKIPTTQLSPEEIYSLEPWDTFAIRYMGGMLTYCAGDSDVCLWEAPKIKPSDTEQTVEFMDGVFSYKKIDGGHLAVRMIRDPKGVVY